ncbi:Hypothetical protein AAM4_0724 [Actinomyces succiniciruminis]|uniref:Uncharacterized protein n=1 Tax=Actinomyces succiniciruminis TaxID=1522002 RepID=A0A1L7RR27_9ACTO|nr:Hypothetical protein AAM4_0724 [Actinomyces succiniciruminis]
MRRLGACKGWLCEWLDVCVRLGVLGVGVRGRRPARWTPVPPVGPLFPRLDPCSPVGPLFPRWTAVAAGYSGPTGRGRSNGVWAVQLGVFLKVIPRQKRLLRHLLSEQSMSLAEKEVGAVSKLRGPTCQSPQGQGNGPAGERSVRVSRSSDPGHWCPCVCPRQVVQLSRLHRGANRLPPGGASPLRRLASPTGKRSGGADVGAYAAAWFVDPAGVHGRGQASMGSTKVRKSPSCCACSSQMRPARASGSWEGSPPPMPRGMISWAT